MSDHILIVVLCGMLILVSMAFNDPNATWPQTPQSSPVSFPKADTMPDELVLERFCGHEVFPIISATWSVSVEGTESSTLNLFVECGHATASLPDTESLSAEPNWELAARSPQLTGSRIKPGDEFQIPKSEVTEPKPDCLTNFYYVDHEGTDRNTIKIIAVDGDRLLMEVTGDCGDVNYYDGSKPPNHIKVRAWFQRD